MTSSDLALHPRLEDVLLAGLGQLRVVHHQRARQGRHRSRLPGELEVIYPNETSNQILFLDKTQGKLMETDIGKRHDEIHFFNFVPFYTLCDSDSAFSMHILNCVSLVDM